MLRPWMKAMRSPASRKWMTIRTLMRLAERARHHARHSRSRLRAAAAGGSDRGGRGAAAVLMGKKDNFTGAVRPQRTAITASGAHGAAGCVGKSCNGIIAAASARRSGSFPGGRGGNVLMPPNVSWYSSGCTALRTISFAT